MAEDQAQTPSQTTHKSTDGQIGTEIHVKVFSQGRTYYDDKAKTLSAVNQTGPFDVLAGHANFLSLITKGDLVIYDIDDDIQKFPVNRGVVHVRDDEVKVFLDV